MNTRTDRRTDRGIEGRKGRQGDRGKGWEGTGRARGSHNAVFVAATSFPTTDCRLSVCLNEPANRQMPPDRSLEHVQITLPRSSSIFPSRLTIHRRFFFTFLLLSFAFRGFSMKRKKFPSKVISRFLYGAKTLIPRLSFAVRISRLEARVASSSGARLNWKGCDMGAKSVLNEQTYGLAKAIRIN